MLNDDSAISYALIPQRRKDASGSAAVTGRPPFQGEERQ